MSNSPVFSLSSLRHSAAHILAQAVLKLYPDAKLGIGPSIEEGFYYDFELSSSLSDEDLPKIEKIMKKIIKEKQVFTQYDLDSDKAVEKLEAQNQPYKLE